MIVFYTVELKSQPLWQILLSAGINPRCLYQCKRNHFIIKRNVFLQWHVLSSREFSKDAHKFLVGAMLFRWIHCNIFQVTFLERILNGFCRYIFPYRLQPICHPQYINLLNYMRYFLSFIFLHLEVTYGAYIWRI